MTTDHKGRLAARFIKAMAISKGMGSVAKGYIESTNWLDQAQLKAAVEAMTTGNSSSLARDVGADFIALVRPETILGRLANIRRVPFLTRLMRQTAGPKGHWVAEGNPKPVAASTFAKDEGLPPRKVVALSAMTDELAQASNAEDIISRDLAAATVEAMDLAFIDPANAGEPDERPASVIYGADSIPATSDPAADLKKATAALVANGGNLRTASWILHPDMAVALNMRGGAFETVGALGGTIAGLPAITSSAVPLGSSGSPIALVDANGIQVGGNTDASLRTSTEASILMETDPESGASQLISLWQTDSLAMMAEIYVNWRVGRPGSTVYIDGADY
ncbi:hypothetical protein AVE30378_05626 [Achromobacter veterisilvae]|uniref:Phage capsid-like C-terminal domain-containing protein n=2 Tax=Achromobacter veterisilvae TaxID=2069367 RepID=A0A446CZF4_9BURK|nr:hypothetical protein AVE30378_05626 [Achromobacter veterisilvae]